MPEHTGTPGLSGGLFTSLLAHSVGLSLVLRHTGVNLPIMPPSVRLFFSLLLRPLRISNPSKI